jgi:hypothetical protein
VEACQSALLTVALTGRWFLDTGPLGPGED